MAYAAGVAAKRSSLVGTRSGSLKVVAVKASKQPDGWARVVVECHCDCGSTRTYELREWSSGPHSCNRNGCHCATAIRIAVEHSKQGWCGEISDSRWARIRKEASGLRRRKWSSVQTRPDIPFEVTREQAWNLFLDQDRRCAKTGRPLVMRGRGHDHWKQETASFDRIDSSKGYVQDNVQWVHKDVQKSKWDFDDQYYVEMCRTVAAYNAHKEPTDKENDHHEHGDDPVDSAPPLCHDPGQQEEPHAHVQA